MERGVQTPSGTDPGVEGLRWPLQGFGDHRLHFTVEFIYPSFLILGDLKKLPGFKSNDVWTVPRSQSECLSIVQT